jgi:anti-anti-sigma regulatory factor
MQTQTQAQGGEARLVRAGELTLTCAQHLQADLLQRLNGGPLVLDLREVTEIDLACLQVVVAAERSFAARGGVLRTLRAPAVERAWNEAGFPQGE